MNCIGLLFLAGYSLPAILDMLLTDDTLKSDMELETVLQSYREVRDIYVETFQESKKVHVDEPKDLNGNNNDMNEDFELQCFYEAKGLNKSDGVNEDLQLPCLNEPKDIDEIKKTDFDNNDEEHECAVIDCSDIQFAIAADKYTDGSYSQSVCSEEDGQKRSCIAKMVDNLGLLDKGINNSIENKLVESVGMLPSVSRDSAASLNDKTECREDAELDVEQANDLDEPKEINEDRDTIETPAPNNNDKLNFDYTTFLYQPKILSLNINFMSKTPNLGQFCLEKFLDVNKCLKEFSISWKGLTFDYFVVRFV